MARESLVCELLWKLLVAVVTELNLPPSPFRERGTVLDSVFLLRNISSRTFGLQVKCGKFSLERALGVSAWREASGIFPWKPLGISAGSAFYRVPYM